ncbi:GMC family oxidoreductase [Amycolatopsis methanolica]|uniref:GMC family oxidoreductase n=1 Tax=Amycolatopsis methanolica TaxID=1814 RepID=UPI003427D983
MTMSYDYDVVVIGSGFGGSVTALRLTEKGYRVGVLEAGRRFDESSYPKTSWDVRNFLWAPKLGCFGLQRIALLRDVVVLAAAGVGGGSLLYANTLYEPSSDSFYNDPQWRDITDWRAELAPHYDQAKRMLGVVRNPLHTPADTVMREVAEDMGVGDTFRLTPVGVLFGPEGTKPGTEIADPFFGGAGPTRRTCIGCGSCMTGCRHNAKNTLPKNYLHLAEANGAQVHPLTTVTEVRPLPGGGYAVRTVRTGKAPSPKHARTFTAEQVVFAAGTYNTQKLLHRLRDDGALPNISRRLGELTRTNSESILSAKSRLPGTDYSTGIAITSSFHPDENTHVEPVRYGKGSNAMALLQTALTDGGGRVPRWLRWLKEIASNPRHLSWHLWPRRWSEKSIILLVMQSLDNSITVFGRKGLFGRHKLSSKQGHGEPNPSWIPAANDAARRTAEKIDGIAGGTIGEIANIPLTAHFIGGCPIGDSPDSGVIDPWHRLYGHPGLHVIDGSTVSANLGVNPSLTITAQAERAMSFWPNKGQPDPRPPVGERYRRLPAVEPKRPAVPSGAPGALRLPVVEVRSKH